VGLAGTYNRLTLASPGPVSNAGQKTSDAFHWQGVIEPGNAIEIRGVLGDIRAEPSSGADVEVIANKHARRSNPDEVQIRTVKHNGGVTICAVYPTGDPGPPNECVPGGGSSHTHNNDVRVDFTVRVPAGVRFLPRTVIGDINATSLKGSIDASSVTGDIRISTSGYARAQTVSGSITASLGDTNWSDQIEFTTISGEIALSLPAGLNTEFEAETISGNISTEFPVTVQGSTGPRGMQGTIGYGGRKLKLKTISGAIKLLRAH
jgi:hypothetical protein